jgi:hypothetical protein
MRLFVYDNLYKVSVDKKLRMDGLHFLSIHEEDMRRFERAFDKVEMLGALRCMGTLGPCSFTMQQWNV